MARSVEDAALLFSVMQGPDPLDPRTLGAPPPGDVMTGLRRGVRGLRLAACRQPSATAAPPRCSRPTTRSLDQLARLGAEIVDVALPCRFADATTMTGRIIGSEGYQLVGHLVDDPASADRPGGAPAHPARPRRSAPRDYLAALAERDALKRGFWPRSTASTRS